MPYHISNKGTLTPCKAKLGKCSLDNQDEHFVLFKIDSRAS